MGLKIKLKRIEKGFKQGEFAKEVGITPQYLRLIEKDEVEPRRDLMKKISGLLETPVTELFFSEEE